jgi:uncharacterized membrane protein
LEAAKHILQLLGCARIVARSLSEIGLNDVYPKLLLFGHYSGCHQLDERSFHFGFRKYPLCARCTGVFCGIILGPILVLFQPPLAAILILPIPLIIDGALQIWTHYESTNSKRLITGIAFGASILNLSILAITRVIV